MLFSPKFPTDSVNWNVENGQQGKNVLSSMIRKEMKAVFRMKTVRYRHRKKNSKTFPTFTTFVQFLSKYR